MNATHPPVGSAYAAGYAKGRHAAKEHVRQNRNPYRVGSPSYQGWNDGYYDERSLRDLTVQRHSALLWSEAPGRN